jgi:hypothetical protein
MVFVSREFVFLNFDLVFPGIMRDHEVSIPGRPWTVPPADDGGGAKDVLSCFTTKPPGTRATFSSVP